MQLAPAHQSLSLGRQFHLRRLYAGELRGSVTIPLLGLIGVLVLAGTVLLAGVVRVRMLVATTAPLVHACGSRHTVFSSQTLVRHPMDFEG